MAIQLDWGDDPFGSQPLQQAYARVNLLLLNFEQQVGCVAVGVYRDQAARAAGKSPVATITVQFGPEAQAAQYNQHDGSVCRAAIPAFAELIASAPDVYGAVRALAYSLIRQQPQFSAGEDV